MKFVRVIPIKLPVKKESIPTLKESQPWIVLTLVILALLGANVYWEIHDTVPPSWDQAMYLENATIFSNALVNGGPLQLLNAFTTSLTIKAPLIALLPLPAYVVFGAGAATGLLFLNFLVILLIVFLFLLFKEVTDRRTALLGVVLTASMPMIYGLSRQFLVEYGLTAIVVMWMYFLVTSDHFRKKNLTLGLLAGLGLLMKATFPLYILAPALIVFVQRLRIDNFRIGKRLLFDIGTVMIAGMLVAGLWYIRNGSNVIHFALSAGYGNTAASYSQGLLEYWRGAFDIGVSPYLFFCLVLFAALSLAIRRTRQAIKGAVNENSLIIASWFLVPFVILSASTAKDIRWLTPVLPVIGLAVAYLFFQLVPGKRVLPAVTLLLLIPIFNLIYTTFPLGNKTITLAESPILTDNWWNQARRPVNEDWKVERVLSDINADARTRQRKTVMMIVDHQYYNVQTFSYFITVRNYPLDLNSIAYFPSDASTAGVINALSQYDYVVAKTGSQGGEWDNYRNEAVRDALTKDKSEFFLLNQYELPDGSRALVYKHL